MLKTNQLLDLDGAVEDLKNKALILQTGIDLQALLRLLVDKGIISREEIREYRNEVSNSPKWGEKSGNTGMKYRIARSGALRCALLSRQRQK